MKELLIKLFFGTPKDSIRPDSTTLGNQWLNLQRVWNNEQRHDMGLERFLRLFLTAVQFIFPGIYIRDKFGRKGVLWKNLVIEFYVLLKTVLPLVFLLTGIYTNRYVIFLTYYLLAETLIYVTTLVFVSEAFTRPHSYRRSVLLLFLNYFEIVFDFAVIYGGLNLLAGKAHSIMDLVYFSFVTSATIGYGDIYPTTDFGKIMVGFHSIVILVFVVLFLNFFGSKVEEKDFLD